MIKLDLLDELDEVCDVCCMYLFRYRYSYIKYIYIHYAVLGIISIQAEIPNGWESSHGFHFCNKTMIGRCCYFVYFLLLFSIQND